MEVLDVLTIFTGALFIVMFWFKKEIKEYIESIFPRQQNRKLSGEEPNQGKSEEKPSSSEQTEHIQDIEVEGGDVVTPKIRTTLVCDNCKAIITRNYETLLNQMKDVDGVLTKLYTREIFTASQNDIFKSKRVKGEKIKYLLDDVLMRGTHRDLVIFYNCLIETKQEALARLLRDICELDVAEYEENEQEKVKPKMVETVKPAVVVKHYKGLLTNEQIEMIKSKYDVFLANMNIDRLIPKLITEKLIEMYEKDELDALETPRKKIEYLLDNVILRGGTAQHVVSLRQMLLDTRQEELANLLPTFEAEDEDTTEKLIGVPSDVQKSFSQIDPIDIEALGKELGIDKETVDSLKEHHGNSKSFMMAVLDEWKKKILRQQQPVEEQQHVLQLKEAFSLTKLTSIWDKHSNFFDNLPRKDLDYMSITSANLIHEV